MSIENILCKVFRMFRTILSFSWPIKQMIMKTRNFFCSSSKPCFLLDLITPLVIQRGPCSEVGVMSALSGVRGNSSFHPDTPSHTKLGGRLIPKPAHIKEIQFVDQTTWFFLLSNYCNHGYKWKWKFSQKLKCKQFNVRWLNLVWNLKIWNLRTRES